MMLFTLGKLAKLEEVYSPIVPAGSVTIAKDHIYGSNYKSEQEYTPSVT